MVFFLDLGSWLSLFWTRSREPLEIIPLTLNLGGLGDDIHSSMKSLGRWQFCLIYRSPAPGSKQVIGKYLLNEGVKCAPPPSLAVLSLEQTEPDSS